MFAGDIPPEELARSLQWIAANPDPTTDALPDNLMVLWLSAAEASLGAPLQANIFLVFGLGRLRAEFERRPHVAEIIVSCTRNELARVPRLTAATGATSCEMELPTETLINEFGLWTQKLALTLLSRRSSFKIQPLLLFRFPPAERVELKNIQQ